MKSKAYKAAQARYDKSRCTRVNLKLNNNTDADIISKLDSVPSKQGYIKGLIRKDINNSGV